MEWVTASVVTLGVGAWHNAVQMVPAALRARSSAIGVAGAATLAAWWLWSTGDLIRGVEATAGWTAAAVVVTGAVVVGGRLHPPLRSALSDRRISGLSRRDLLVHVVVRIPLLVALSEEVLFRGVVWWALQRAGGAPLAWLGSSAAFAAAHIAVAADQAAREGRPLRRWVLTTVAATFAAGLALGALQWHTGGLWAPAGVHAAVNITLALGVRWHARSAPHVVG